MALGCDRLRNKIGIHAWLGGSHLRAGSHSTGPLLGTETFDFTLYFRGHLLLVLY